MGRRFAWSGFAIIVLLAITVNAAPSSSCKKGCSESDNGLVQYAPGNVYEYNFDSILTMGVNSGGNADDTTLKVTGLAKLYAEGNCGYTVQLSAIKVSATKEGIEKKLAAAIMKPVHFTMTSGKVDPEICSDPNDNVYALNVKRGIISMLQTQQNDEQEVDVFGLCPTHTSTSRVGNTDVVTKIRNLNNCAYRETITSGMMSGVVNEQAGVRSSMELRSDYSKETKIAGGVVEQVYLVEEYKLDEEPNGSSDLHAKVTTTLKVKNPAGAKAAAPATGANRVSIIFQQPNVYTNKNLAALKAAVASLTEINAEYVHVDSAKSFVDLIRLMRNSDAETLLELAAVPYPNKVLARKIYIDALVRTRTAEAAKAIMKQLNKMDDKEKLVAVLSLSATLDVDKDVLLQATNLLTPNAAKEVYLAVGNIVSKYCLRNNCADNELEAISKKFVDNLKHCKPNTKKDEERVVYVLKGIANTHHLAANVAGSLAECASVGRSSRVRVAALQAFSAASCEPALKKKAMELLRNRNEDSELRIEAYIAAINCPTADLANDIAEIVNSETVNQVGGFIKSNLLAIRDSTDASRAAQRTYLGNVRVTKQFPKDYRRYSFNNELSYKLEALGLSASADYKLIYSQHGFLPRSARLNVTTELYGTNFNIFEASIRQENIENVLEYYVGPKGLLNKNFEDIMKMIEIGDHKGGARARRSIADDTSKIAKKYKTYGSKNVEDLNLDLSLKLFGSEIMFLSLGDNVPTSLDEVIKEVSTLFENTKQELSSFSKEFRMHNLFMDSEMTYPTAVGIPFDLSVQGFAATKLDCALSIDVDSLLQQNWQNSNYRLKVVPSVDIHAEIKAGFNAYVLSTGVRMQSSLQSATGGDFKASFVNDGNGFNLDIELPREKLELVNLRVNADFFVAEQDKPIKGIQFKGSKKQKTDISSNCFNQLEMIGFTFCFETKSQVREKGKAVEELFVGPVELNLYVLSERNIKLSATHVPAAADGKRQWTLDYSTPGSKVAHDTTLTLETGMKSGMYARLSFDNPQFRLAVETGVTNDNKEMVVYGQYEQNGDVKKSKIGFTKKGKEYHPVIEVQDKNQLTNNISGYRAEGKVVVQQTGDKTSKYTFDNFQLINAENERVTINGWVVLAPAALTADLTVAPGQQAYKLNGNFKVENNEYEAGLFVNDVKTPDNVMGGSALVQLGQESVNVRVAGKALAWEVNANTGVEYVKSETENELKSSNFNGDLSVKHKNAQLVGLKVKGATEGTNKFDFSAELHREKQVGSLTVRFANKQKSQHDYVLEVNGKLNKHFVDVLSKCDFNGNHFLLDNVVAASCGLSLTVKGEVGQRYSLQDVYVDLAGGLQLNSKDKPSQWLLKVVGTPEKTTTEFKLNRENAELVKCTGETQHPQDKITAGKFMLNVKNMATAKGDFKVAKNGKGELTLNVDTLKTEPKHKLEVNSKFTVLAPKYDVETTITLDSEHKVYFKTENQLEKNKFSTKNTAEVANKKVSFNANGAVKGDWKLNGEIQGAFKLTCPEGRVVDGSVKRKVTTNQKTGIAQGTVDVQLNDAPTTGGKRSVGLTGTLEKLNTKTKDVSVAVQLAFVDLDQKQLNVKAYVKNLPKGQNKMAELGATVTGDLLNKAIDVTIAADEYGKNHARGHVQLKYDNDLSVELDGNYNLGERGTPATFNVQGNLQAPQTNFKTIALQTNGKFLRATTNAQDPIVVEVHFDEKLGNGEFVRFNSVYKGSNNLGALNVDVETKQMNGPLKLGGSYTRTHSGDVVEGNAVGKQKYTADFDYDGKYIKTTTDFDYAGAESGNMHFTLDSSFESVKDVDVVVRAHSNNDGTAAVIVEAKQGDKTYTVNTKLYRGTYKKGFNVAVGLPNAAPIICSSEFEMLGERKAKMNVHIENLIDLDFNGNAEASYKGVDDFYLTAQWDSAKLQLDKYELDVRTEGKVVKLNLKHAKGVVFDGTATVALKKEKNKAIIEGQGHVQYLGKTQNSNFRLIRQTYELATDKEFGYSYTFNGNFGPKNGVSTFKLTNRDVNVKLSICEEKKQCTNVQMQSIVEKDDQDSSLIQHSIMVLFDLRELGYPYEFEFQSKTIRQGYKLQYSLDSSIISNNNMKYQLVVSALPTNTKLQLKLPSREILFETKQQYPSNGQIFGHYENSATFHIDRVNKPNDVMSLGAKCDLSGVEHSKLNAKFLLKLEHPAIRAMSISGQFDVNREARTINNEVILDIFQLPEQKITASSKLQNEQSSNGFNITTHQAFASTGLGFQYELNGHTALNTDTQQASAGFDLSCSNELKANGYVFASKDKLEAATSFLNEPVFQLNADFNRQKQISTINSKLQILNHSPVEWTTVLQPSMAKVNIKNGNVFNGNGEIKLGKELKFSFDGYGKKIADARVGLDAANFLQTTFKTDEANLNEFLTTLNTQLDKDVEEVRNKLKARFAQLQEMVEKQYQLLHDAMPDLKKLVEQYEANMNEIIKELEKDPSFKQIADVYRNLYNKVVKITDEYGKVLLQAYEKVQESVQALWTSLLAVLKETVLPAWEEFTVKAAKILSDLRAEVISIGKNVLKSFMEVLEKYGPTLKSYGKAVNEALKPYNEVTQELIKFLTTTFDEVSNELREWIAKLPTFDAIRADIKEKIEKMKLVEKIIELVNNLFDQLQILPTTPETTDFFRKLQDYLIAKLKREPVNDERFLEELFSLFNKAVRSVIATLELTMPSAASTFSGEGLGAYFSTLPASLDVFSKLPTLFTFRLSLINYLLNENWESVFTKDLLNSWVFFNNFELKAHLVDGRHVLTFDGEHLTFTGNCKYILAQDSVDNNFTVIAQLNNGKLKSIYLTDRDGNYLEIADTGALKLNGAAVEYPQHTNGMHAWRMYYTVWMLSEYGVSVMCTTDLKTCHISVNGFYTSKTRGLFGNGNAEPSDDFIQMDGTIAADANAFVNGYGMGKCAAAAPDLKTYPHAELCNEIFGIDSTLAVGYLLQNSKPYREACDMAVAAAPEKDKEAAACTIATAYGSALKLDNVFAMLPPRCLKCQGPVGQRDLAQEFSVKLPNQKADVLFVVDLDVTPTVLSGLIAPTITEVRDTLKARGFTDVQIGVVVYNETQRYPALLTSDNGKLNYNGNLADFTLTGPSTFCDNCVGQLLNDKRLIDVYAVLEKLIKTVVPQSDEKAYGIALNYPFRAAAAKSIVAVRSKTMDYDNLLKFVRAQVAGAVSRFDGALLHMITPVKDLALDGVAAEKLIGFNSRLVATVDGKDNKKRPKLQFENSMGIDFVLNNGGWVFATQNFDSMKAQDQKKALNQITNSIADTMYKTEIQADCVCLPIHGLHAQHKCSIKSSTFVPNKKVKSA